MFLESLFTKLFDKYLGDYIEKFDKSQLVINKLKGSVVLHDLKLKEHALDDLDLPVEIKIGYIKKLTLLTQLTSWYNKPLRVLVDGVYVLAVPNVAERFNDEKEETVKDESKQKTEDTIKLEDKENQQKKNSFAEKVIAHIINKLEITIVNVHLRYEDNYSNPKRPFSFGVLLELLQFKTKDENGEECVVKGAVTQIVKFTTVRSLAVYWKSESKHFDYGKKTEDWFKKTNDVYDREKDAGFRYLIKPISPSAKLILNTNPKLKKSPKILLTVELDDISVVLSKVQFDNILEMIESFEKVKSLRKIKEKRPVVPLKDHDNEWTNIMEKYKEVYAKKLDGQKITKEIQDTIDYCERNLNVNTKAFVQQIAEVETAKRKKAKNKSDEIIEDIKKTFQEQFKSDEKSELYTAIGYAETDSDITRPKEYIAAKLEAKFAKMTLTLIDDQSRDPYIIKFHLKDVFSSLQQRPAAKAIKFEANVKTYTVNGTPQEGLIPDMVTSQANMTDNKNHLLDVLFETNPLDEACDTRVKLNTRHIEFIYDAVTVNNLVNFFKPPDSVNLQELTQTAVNTIDAIMERSATGLSHFINQKKVTEISVDIQPSYVIIPKIGRFKKDSCALILDLGNLKMETVDEPTTTAYDRFNITLDRFQILFSSSGDDWRVYRKESKSHMHLLEPIEMHIVLQKCRLDKDRNLAKIKLSAELPLLSLNMSDKRLHELIELADSIPLPESAVLPRKEFSLARSFRNMKKKDKANSLRSKQSQFPNYTKMEIKFKIKQVDISIHQVDDDQVVRLKVASLGTEVAIHTCDIDVEAYLRGIILQHEVDGQVVNLVNSPREDGPTNLLHVHYIKTKKDDPNFDTAYGKIEQKIDVAFTRLQIILYQEAVLHVLELVHKMKQAAKRQKYIVTVRTEEGKDRKKEEKRTKYGTRYESARLQDLSGTPYVDKNDPLKQRDYKEALSEIEIQGITVCGKQMSDKSIEVNVKLQDIVLEDSRHHKTDGITRMIQRRQSPISKDGISNMIDVSYKQDCSEDSTVDARINSLYICVCLDFLRSIGDFAKKCIPKKEQGMSVKHETKQEKNQKKDRIKKPSLSSYCMDIVVKIENPEIILIEDQLNPYCNCLVLNTETTLKMKVHPEYQKISTKVNDLQIFSCVFSNREAVAAQILNKSEIWFESEKNFNKGTEMRIETSNLIFNISPATIKTISKICAALATTPELKKETCTYTVPHDLWEVKKLVDSDFWFLSEEPEKQEEELVNVDAEWKVRLEQLIAKIPLMIIRIEGGVGMRTVPLLRVESSISADVKNWTSKLSVEGTLKFEVAYHNEKLSVWEPLLEPIVEDGKKERWELGLEIKVNENIYVPSAGDEDILDKSSLPPKMSIYAFSHVDMQLTLSKTCIEVLNNLFKAFGDAYMLVEPSVKAGEILSPFCIRNQLDLEVVITLDDSLKVEESNDLKVKIPPGKQSKLWNKKKIENISEIEATQDGDEKTFNFLFEKLNVTKEVTVKRAEKRLYKINTPTKSEEVLTFIVNTETPIGQKIVSIQSNIKIKNHFQIPIEVYYVDDTITCCGVVASDTDFSVPLRAVYTQRKEFQFKPNYETYHRSASVSWKDSKKFGTVQLLKCEPTNRCLPFYITVKVDVEDVYFEVGNTLSAKSYIFHLSPTFILHNLLPYPIRVQFEGIAEERTLQKGENTALLHACFEKNSCVNITILTYKGKEWSGKSLISSNIPEQSILTFEANQCTPKCTLNLGLHCKTNDGCMDISVYSPYWMVNKTRQDLFYKATDSDAVTLEHDNLDIVMFSFKEKTLLSFTKRVALKIADCDWSDRFSLEKSLAVQCKNSKKQTFKVGVKISRTSSDFTKICTFTPFYILMNSSAFTVMCQEIQLEKDNWIEVPSKEGRPFWPVQSGKDLAMKAKFSGSDIETFQFCFSKPHTTLMKLSTQHGGLNVDCQVTKLGTVVTFSEYRDGMATVLLVNHTEKSMIQFNQSDVLTKHSLKAKHYLLYTWENSTCKREIIWACGQTKNQKNDLQQDKIGEVSVHDNSKIYWVSFMNGLQRCLLFTEDLGFATVAHEAVGPERLKLEINICMQGLGLSLVNDYKQIEVAYLGVRSSGILWEEKKERFTILNRETGETLEKAYQQYVAELEKGHTPTARISLNRNIEVDWNDMMMYKPNKISIRRRVQKGIWLQIKTSPHQKTIHANIQRLQLDNQMSDAIFRTALAPTSRVNSIVADTSEPCTKLRILTGNPNHGKILQFKYVKAIFEQEMTLKVDLRFINELFALLPTSASYSRDQQKRLIENDYQTANAAFKIGTKPSLGNIHVYDHLSISPIKINLCFSSQGCGGEGIQEIICSYAMKLFLKSAGVVIANAQEVSLTLDCFKGKRKFYNLDEIKKEVIEHYKSQAEEQWYMFLFGAEVLGSPVGVCRGIADGAKDLVFKPYEGAKQGPDKFVKGIADGVGSLFDHTVDGAAGSASKITGVLGKAAAASTFDDDYQKKRRQQMRNKQHASASERLASGGKGVVQGVFDGVTGIVRKPYQGAKKEGVGGFFKGIGKGIVGVVTRPASGIIDLASESFEEIKRVAIPQVDVRRQRKPRMFSVDKIIRPYNKQEADGFMIMQETDEGKFASSDQFIAHAITSKNCRYVLILTDKRVIYANRGEILGNWDAEWSYTWGEIKEIPKRTLTGIEIVLTAKEGIFGKGYAKKDVRIFDSQTADFILGQLEQFMKRQK